MSSPADDDDLLREILIRLPTQPSSLLRASLVCKRWLGLVKNPRFLRRFRTHHGKPPLLGFFFKDYEDTFPFVPSLKPPDRISAERFTSPFQQGDHDFDLLDCRHGLVLLVNRESLQFLIWDPVTGEQCLVSIHPLHRNNGEKLSVYKGMVRCVNRDQGHVHGHCHSGPFQVALVVGPFGRRYRESVCVYSSATGTWSHAVSTELPSQVTRIISEPMKRQKTLMTLVDDSLYCLNRGSTWRCIIEYDFVSHSLAKIKLPPDAIAHSDCVFTLMPAEDGGLGLVIVSNFRAQLWKREADCDGAAVWVPGRIIKLDKLRSAAGTSSLIIVGFAEDNNVMLVWTATGVFMVDIQSTKIEKLCNNSDQQDFPDGFYPLASFYGAGSMPLQ
ncbi:hypothetical protein QYE76_041406 [Lolium multiflorum]|uniref:F-box domain-containing protein n=1 Tax=Lolium multiflorum TaxID=4521 RepID=A0AAD8TF87_LOLMU|nr:hypothetical protein QYE76_041384 [Lolium multiflorum]KAK1680558.1 hypothetical protein QYE76_041406 [Lolium multiflorum]